VYSLDDVMECISSIEPGKVKITVLCRLYNKETYDTMILPITKKAEWISNIKGIYTLLKEWIDEYSAILNEEGWEMKAFIINKYIIANKHERNNTKPGI